MPSLNDVVKKGQTLADVISKGVAAAAPISKNGSNGKRRGNLRRELRKANTIDTMLDTKGMDSKELEFESVTISIDYAPPGAKYGKFWNEPTLSRTVKKGKTKNIPKSINFVDKALSDKKVEQAIDDLVDLIGDNIVARIEEQLSKAELDY